MRRITLQPDTPAVCLCEVKKAVKFETGFAFERLNLKKTRRNEQDTFENKNGNKITVALASAAFASTILLRMAPPLLPKPMP